jgi:hypothetical protein
VRVLFDNTLNDLAKHLVNKV